jgi:photosystem II stability/assembly factor-like uncharacterized protein
MKFSSTKYFFISILFFLFSFDGRSQDDLNNLLKDKTKFDEIVQFVENYFNQHPELKSEGEGEESPYLHWKRWEWYMSGRLGPEGEVINVTAKLMQGLAEKEKMQSYPAERNINSGWTFVGPSNSPLQNPNASLNGMGRVNRVVFHPTNPDILFACTPNGGLWRTINGGITWHSLTDYIPSIAVADFVISYANTNIMYLLTGDGQDGWNGFGYGQRSIGILKSTDGGVSWHQTGQLPNTGDSYYGYALEQSSVDPNVLIAATNVGIYRTTNGGDTWAQEASGFFYDVKFKPGSGNIVYATGSGHLFYRSTDSGDTWQSNSTYNINPTYCSGFGGDRMLIAVAPTNINKVYLLSAPRVVPGVFCGVWLSTDSGVSFDIQSTTPNVFGSDDDGSDDTDQTSYDMAITCRSDLSTTVFVAGCTVWKSIDEGDTWIHSTDYSGGGMVDYIHPDVHDLAYNPINDWLYASTDGGVYRSQDHGVNWTDLTNDLEVSQIYHMAGWDGNINKLLIGLQDNGLKYRKDNTSDFYHLGCCDGFEIAFNNINGQPAYGTVNNSVVKYYYNGTASVWTQPDSNDQWFKTLVMHNTDTSIILVGTGQGIIRTTNAGATWTNEGATGSWSLAACPSNTSRFYASGGSNFQTGDGGVYFSSNTGDTWTLKSNNPGFPSASLWDKITDVIVRNNNSAEVYACFGGFNEGIKIVKSTNTGDTWTNISDNLPNVPINCMAIDNDGGLYAGTDIGVFYKSSSMPDWMTWSNGLPNVPVVELVIFDDGTNKRIRAATYGRGVWQSNLASTCDAAVIVTGDLTGIRHYEASTSVSSASNVKGGLGTFISFQSGNYIALTEGFNVVDDSEFLGFISPCGQGGIPGVNGSDLINRADPNSSIILLRRMWDPATELPYGFIHTVDVEDGTAEISFEIKSPGKVEIIAARQVQEKLSVLYAGEQKKGRHTFKADLSGLPEEFHYILLFYEGKLVHFQEMDLRE